MGKSIDELKNEWDIPRMQTAKVDDRRRVYLASAKPGEVFAVEASPDGGFRLTKLEPVAQRPAKVRFKKRGRFTVGIVDRPINEQALEEALKEFP